MSTSRDSKVLALDELFHEAGMYRQGKEVRELYDFISRFPKFGAYNASLIHAQKPGSVYVASAGEWRRFNRTIKPGARPVVILWPFAPVRFMFDLSDTEGDKPFPEELLRPFRTDGRLPPNVFERLLKNLPRDGIALYEADHGTASAGYIEATASPHKLYTGDKEVYVLYDLVVNCNHSPEEKFATIAHELGHLYCGHLGSPETAWWPNRTHLGVDEEEFEAESVAWLVCRRVGIANPSASYLSTYLKEDNEIPQVSIDHVLRAVSKVEAMMYRHLPLRTERDGHA